AGLGISLGGIVGGNILIENLFRYPGIGTLMVEATALKDVNTMMACLSMMIILVLSANLIIDLLLPIIDPRVRRSGFAGSVKGEATSMPFRTIWKASPKFRIGVIIFMTLVIAAVFHQLIITWYLGPDVNVPEAGSSGAIFQDPSWKHPLGTDRFG